MNYPLTGSENHYFHGDGITSLTEVLKEVRAWLIKTNAYIEAIDLHYQTGEEYWSCHVVHSGNLTGKYENHKADLTEELDELEVILNKITDKVYA